jgi:drug/metabolite transporter (DMT)-like permease
MMKSMSPARKAHWQIHFCVLLWGFTAILGKLIGLPALTLVCWRMLIVTVALLLLPRVWRGMRALSAQLLAVYAGIGALVAIHWLTFYAAIKLANASVAATCIALGPVFLALIEPLIARRRFDLREVALGLAVVPGVALVVGGIPHAMRVGVGVGILSAILVAVFGSLNKRFVERADALVVTCVELGAGTLFLSVVACSIVPFASVWKLPDRHDAILLLVLALGCTLLPFALSLVALRRISAFSAQIAVSLEPVYAILIAIVLLGEQRELDASFYIGVAIILAAVFAHPWIGKHDVSGADITGTHVDPSARPARDESMRRS